MQTRSGRQLGVGGCRQSGGARRTSAQEPNESAEPAWQLLLSLHAADTLSPAVTLCCPPHPPTPTLFSGKYPGEHEYQWILTPDIEVFAVLFQMFALIKNSVHSFLNS